MPKPTDTPTNETASGHPANRPMELLIVARHTAERRQIASAVTTPNIRIHLARSIAEAHRRMGRIASDVIVIDHQLTDGAGLDFIRAVKRQSPETEAILLADHLSTEQMITAMRGGAHDVLLKPLNERELTERISESFDRCRRSRRQQHRIERLRRVCRKLNEARLEVSEQVNVLCNDLVNAYQDLAGHVTAPTLGSDYTSMVRYELDLEAVVRRTLEFLLQKAGPTNAAIFLPASADEYTLGGYVNYDCTTESADLLLDHLADVVAPRIACTSGTQVITDNSELSTMFGDDAAYLADSHLLTVACEHDDETLAVIALFRDASQPFDDVAQDTLDAIAPLLARHLTKIIRIHHRHLPEF